MAEKLRRRTKYVQRSTNAPETDLKRVEVADVWLTRFDVGGCGGADTSEGIDFFDAYWTIVRRDH